MVMAQKSIKKRGIIQNKGLDCVFYAVKMRKEVLVGYLDIRNENHKQLVIDTMKTIFYAHSMDEHVEHVEEMYDLYWGPFLAKNRVLHNGEDKLIYEDEEVYKKFLCYILERTIRECEEFAPNSRKAIW